MRANLVNAVCVLVKTIIAKFVRYIQRDQQASRYANGHSQDINKGKEFVLYDITKSDFQVVFEHGKI